MSQASLGIDASLTSSGVVAINPQGEILGSWTLPLDRKAKGDARLRHLRQDLLAIFEWLRLGGHEVSEVVLEDLPKNAQGAGLTGRAQGVVREVLSLKGLEPKTLAPASLKLAWSGSGRATKDDMRKAVPPDQDGMVHNSDEVDALALANIGAYLRDWPHTLAHVTNLSKLRE